MKFIYKLERKFGHLAINNLMKYVVILYVLGFFVNMVNPDFYYRYLMLDIDKILHGQVWRIVTFLIQPIEDNIFYLFLSVYLYYMIGNSLERQWGAFRFNLYFLSGILFNILATVIIYIVTKLTIGYGYSYPISITYINQSMFFAFALMYSNVQFLLFFVIPVKVKYLAWIYGGIIAYNVFSYLRVGFTTTDILMKTGCFSAAFSIVVALANFLIFFFMTRNYKKVSFKEYKRKAQFRKSVNEGRAGSNVVNFNGRTTITRHKCAVCGRTELDDDSLEFRFCSKCDGNYEYCSEHLYTHEHVKKSE